MKILKAGRLAIVSMVFFSSIISAQELVGANSPEGAKVYIIAPQDGEVVGTTFKVKFGLSGMGVAPAGADIANTGHHHLIVDGEIPKMGMPIGTHITHFGGGQTETTLTLEKGQHTLQLILGDKFHIPHSPPVISEKITITVE